MTELVRQQRWLQWRNMDESSDPVCPAFGCIELIGFEMVGATIILQGRSATAFDRDPEYFPSLVPSYTSLWGDLEFKDTHQGGQWNHVFNDQIAVMPGKIGHCTFDLPTWAAVTIDTVLPGFGSVLTFGNFLQVPYVPFSVPPVTITIGGPWRLGLAPPEVNGASAYITDEAGWNTYHLDEVYQPDEIHRRAFIGGARTFLRAANSFLG